MSNTSSSSSGIGVSSLLGVVFVTLKLTHVITWPWLWVLAPFWLPITVVVVVIGIVALFVALT